MNATPPRVVVLGGGSAGWITACLVHREWAAKGGTVTVIESPEIGIIGVGEGSTPQLKAFFEHIGVDEAEWMPACDATYKLGIRFTGWSERTGFGSYFHPFPGPVDLHTEPAFIHNCTLARRGFDVFAHPDGFFLAAILAQDGKGPHPGSGFPFAPSYGYHFDAHKLGAFLRGHAVAKGVEHRQAKVEQVQRHENGEVSALVCEDGTRVEGDFFIDCSGFRSVIAQQALGERFIGFGDNLFNDRAVVMPTGHVAPYRPQTDAVAMKAGWRWSIPLTSRIGNGYVYSSAHTSDEDAEAELRQALGIQNENTTARIIPMKVGRVENSWTHNCLAAGLAQGFIEPLEATALHIVIATALEFLQAFEDGEFSALHRDAFNARAAVRYEGIRDYIVAHYRLNQRSDTEYWQANASNQHLSSGLKAMITAWFTQNDLRVANQSTYNEPHYSSASWHCLFAGYGTFPPSKKIKPLAAEYAAIDIASINHVLNSSASNFENII